MCEMVGNDNRQAPVDASLFPVAAIFVVVLLSLVGTPEFEMFCQKYLEQFLCIVG